MPAPHTYADLGPNTPGRYLDESLAYVQQQPVTESAAVMSAGAVTLDWSIAQSWQLPLTANLTSISITNTPADDAWRIFLTLVQPLSGGFTVTWPAAWYAQGGGQKPTNSLGASAVDLFVIWQIQGRTMVLPGAPNLVSGF